jgi:hypothetical protein
MREHRPSSFSDDEGLRESFSEAKDESCVELSADFDVFIAINHRSIESGEQNSAVLLPKYSEVEGVRSVLEGDCGRSEGKAEVAVGIFGEDSALRHFEARLVRVGDSEGELVEGERLQDEGEALGDGTLGLEVELVRAEVLQSQRHCARIPRFVDHSVFGHSQHSPHAHQQQQGKPHIHHIQISKKDNNQIITVFIIIHHHKISNAVHSVFSRILNYNTLLLRICRHAFEGYYCIIFQYHPYFFEIISHKQRKFVIFKEDKDRHSLSVILSYYKFPKIQAQVLNEGR